MKKAKNILNQCTTSSLAPIGKIHFVSLFCLLTENPEQVNQEGSEAGKRQLRVKELLDSLSNWKMSFNPERKL